LPSRPTPRSGDFPYPLIDLACFFSPVEKVGLGIIAHGRGGVTAGSGPMARFAVAAAHQPAGTAPRHNRTRQLAGWVSGWSRTRPRDPFLGHGNWNSFGVVRGGAPWNFAADNELLLQVPLALKCRRLRFALSSASLRSSRALARRSRSEQVWLQAT
jgi:hypothetical protein